MVLTERLIALALAAIAGLLLGVFVGAVEQSAVIEDDCRALGLHRFGDTIFECRPAPGKGPGLP